MNLIKYCVDNSSVIEQRSRRRCHSHCQEHLFSLTQARPTHPYPNKSNGHKASLTTVVNFCPKIPRGCQPVQSTYPEFNHDRLFFTDAFILGIDRKQLQANRNLEHTEHIRLASRTCQKNYKVHFPKPNDTHTLCAVCKINYGTHYYAHILSDYHKAKIKECPYNKSIEQLAQRFSALHPQNQRELSSPFKLPNHIKQLQEVPNDNSAGLQSSQPITAPVEVNQLDPNLANQHPLQTKGKRAKKSTKQLPKKSQLSPSKNQDQQHNILQTNTQVIQHAQPIVAQNLQTLIINNEEPLSIQPQHIEQGKKESFPLLTQAPEEANKQESKPQLSEVKKTDILKAKTKRIKRAKRNGQLKKGQLQKGLVEGIVKIAKKRGRKPNPKKFDSVLDKNAATNILQEQLTLPTQDLLQKQELVTPLVPEQKKQEKIVPEALEEHSLDFLNQLRFDEHSYQKQPQFFQSQSLQVQQEPQKVKQTGIKQLEQEDHNDRKYETPIQQPETKLVNAQSTQIEKPSSQPSNAKQVVPLEIGSFVLKDFLQKKIIQKLSQQREIFMKSQPKLQIYNIKQERKPEIAQASPSESRQLKKPIVVIDLIDQQSSQEVNQAQRNIAPEKAIEVQQLSVEQLKLQGKKDWKQLFGKYTQQDDSQNSGSSKFSPSNNNLKRQRNDEMEQQKLSKKKITLFKPHRQQSKAKLVAFEANSSDISSGTGSEGFQLQKFIFESKHKRANRGKKLLGSFEPIKTKAFRQLERRVDKKSAETWCTIFYNEPGSVGRHQILTSDQMGPV